MPMSGKNMQNYYKKLSPHSSIGVIYKRRRIIMENHKNSSILNNFLPNLTVYLNLNF